jgi:hypothetical protein
MLKGDMECEKYFVVPTRQCMGPTLGRDPLHMSKYLRDPYDDSISDSYDDLMMGKN